MLKKMFLTGALVVIAPGSSPQLLCGLFIAVAYQLVTLKCAPFVEDPDDWLSFVTSTQLVITLLFALVLALDTGEKRDYDTDSIGSFLIGLHVGQFAFFVVSIALLRRFLVPHCFGCGLQHCASERVQSETSAGMMCC